MNCHNRFVKQSTVHSQPPPHLDLRGENGWQSLLSSLDYCSVDGGVGGGFGAQTFTINPLSWLEEEKKLAGTMGPSNATIHRNRTYRGICYGGPAPHHLTSLCHVTETLRKPGFCSSKQTDTTLKETNPAFLTPAELLFLLLLVSSTDSQVSCFSLTCSKNCGGAAPRRRAEMSSYPFCVFRSLLQGIWKDLILCFCNL